MTDGGFILPYKPNGGSDSGCGGVCVETDTIHEI